MLDFAKIVHEAIGIESPRQFIALFALCGLLLFGALGWLVDKGYRVKLKQELSGQQPTAAHVIAERQFLPSEIDIEYLTGLYREHTSLQADAIASSYIGKWIRLSVKVDDISQSTLTNRVHIVCHPVHETIGEREHVVYIGLNFDSTWADRVAVLRRGSPVSAVGILSDIDAHSVQVAQCELVSSR